MRSHTEPTWEKEEQERQIKKEEVQALPLYSLRSYNFPASDPRTSTMPYWNSCVSCPRA